MLTLEFQGNRSRLATTFERDHETEDVNPEPSPKKRKSDAVGHIRGARETETSSKKTNKKGTAKPAKQSPTKSSRKSPAKLSRLALRNLSRKKALRNLSRDEIAGKVSKQWRLQT
jgi:hypothetical protein